MIRQRLLDSVKRDSVACVNKLAKLINTAGHISPNITVYIQFDMIDTVTKGTV